MKFHTLLVPLLFLQQANAFTFAKDVHIKGKRAKIDVSEGPASLSLASASSACSDDEATKHVKVIEENGSIQIIQNSEICMLKVNVHLPSSSTLTTGLGQAIITSAGPTPNLNISAGSGSATLESNSESSNTVNLSFGSGTVKIVQKKPRGFGRLNVNIGSGYINYTYPQQGTTLTEHGSFFGDLKTIQFDSFSAKLSTGMGKVTLNPTN